MKTVAIFGLVIVVGLVAVDAPPNNLSHTREGDSRSKRQTENQVCIQSLPNGTIIVMIPLTSDSGNYIIVRDLDTSEDFKLFSNDPVSRDLTIFVDQSSGCYYILPGNLMRRIEIRNETHSYHRGRIDEIAKCEACPCGEDVMSYGCPGISSTVSPPESTSHNTSKTNPEDGSYWYRVSIALSVVLSVVVVLLVALICRMYVLNSGISVSLFGQCRKVKNKSDPEQTVPQHIRTYCTANFLVISDFQRKTFESTYFECGIFQYRGIVFPLYVYEGELRDIPNSLKEHNGFLVPKAGNDNNPGTVQVYSTARDPINDLMGHLEDSYCRDWEYKMKLEDELSKMKEENERLTKENSELNLCVQELEQTCLKENKKLNLRSSELNLRVQELEQTRLELKKLKEEKERLTLGSKSKLSAYTSPLEPTSLSSEKREGKVVGGNHVQKFLEYWENYTAELPTSEQQIEESQEESSSLLEEAKNNAREQSDPKLFF